MEVEAETQGLCADRHHTLGVQEDGRHLAHAEPQHDGRDREDQRPTQASRHGFLELAMAERFGRYGVDGAVPRAGVDRGHDHPHEVAAGDPAHPLAAVAEHGPEAEARRQRHHRQGATVAIQHEPDPEAHDPQALGARPFSLGLPGATEIGREAVPCPRRLIQNLLRAVAVEADG